MLSALRASPPDRRAISSTIVQRDLGVQRLGSAPRRSVRAPPRRAARARRSGTATASAELTSKYGFSVVAPIRVSEPFLDGRQQRVLLCLVEAMDLVQEEDRPLPGAAEPVAGTGEGGTHVGDRRRDRGELLEGRTGGDARRCGPGSSCRCRAARRGSSSRPGPRRSRAAAPSPRRAPAPVPRTRRASSDAAAGRAALPRRRRSRAASEKGRSRREVCSRRGDRRSGGLHAARPPG